MIKFMNNNYMLSSLINMIFPTIYSRNKFININDSKLHRYICPLKHNMAMHSSAKVTLNSCRLDHITDISCILLLVNSYYSSYSSSKLYICVVIEIPNNNSKIERISFMVTDEIHTLIDELIYKQFNVTLKLNTAMNIKIIYNKINYIAYSSYLI